MGMNTLIRYYLTLVAPNAAAWFAPVRPVLASREDVLAARRARWSTL